MTTGNVLLKDRGFTKHEASEMHQTCTEMLSNRMLQLNVYQSSNNTELLSLCTIMACVLGPVCYILHYFVYFVFIFCRKIVEKTVRRVD